VKEPITELSVAVMVVVPAETAVKTPLALIVATFGFEELQVTVLVTSLEVPSGLVWVACNCIDCPAETDPPGEVIAIVVDSEEPE
jgi:hypothetical protein